MQQWFLHSLPYLFYPAWFQLERALANPNKAQTRLKTQIIRSLTRTEYGRALGISQDIDWQSLPIVTYDDLLPWIEQQREHPQKPILTSEKILFWEQTSGNSGAAKWIPYTTSLIGSFSAMFCVWVYDLMRHGTTLHTGKTYLCISPQIGTSPQGIDDTAYLSQPLKWLSRQFLVPMGNRFPDAETFRWELAIALLMAADLEVVSLWSPSFLSLQLDYIQTHQRELKVALGDRLSPERQGLLMQNPIPWQLLWSELKLISCWDRQFSADRAQSLRHYFPTVFIQGKGLLATEAPMTVPLIPAGGFVPLLNQVVFEFMAPNGELLPIPQLEQDVVYEVVISPLGGFCRYRIGDRLKVSHYYQQTPCLEFVGRGDHVSDLVGEKLTEAFVEQIMQGLGLLDGGFCCLTPINAAPPYYCLYLSRSSQSPTAIAEQMENALQQSYHYQKARQFGQLGAAQIIIDPHIASKLQGKKRVGDRKYPLLQPAFHTN